MSEPSRLESHHDVVALERRLGDIVSPRLREARQVRVTVPTTALAAVFNPFARDVGGLKYRRMEEEEESE